MFPVEIFAKTLAKFIAIIRAIYQQAAHEQQHAIRHWAEQASYADLLQQVLTESDELS